MILAGAVKDGDRVAISAEGGVLTFNGEPPQTAEIEHVRGAGCRSGS